MGRPGLMCVVCFEALYRPQFVPKDQKRKIFILANASHSNYLAVFCGDEFLICGDVLLVFVSTEIKTSKVYLIKFQNFFSR